MANISDVIESFILSTIGDDSIVDVSRSELANHFSCAKSQINYVLATRFTTERGYLVEGHRGGGGYIRIIRIRPEGTLGDVIRNEIGDELSERQALHILERLCAEDVITRREAELVAVAVSNKSLSNPYAMQDRLRAEIMKNVLLSLTR